MAKNIVICTDGTWNRPDQKDRGRVVPSNVVKMARAVSDKGKRGDRDQIYYYDTGVGTGNIINKVIGGITGAGLVLNTKQAYSFVCQHYQEGDQLYIFGFSRGAYTARYLAGMIGRVGIRKDVAEIPREERIAKIEESFKQSRKWRGKPHEMPEEIKSELRDFRNQYCHDDNTVHFLGVWDTVGSLGIPLKPIGWIGRWRFRFVDVRLGPHISNAFHALAIDEKRKNFRPTLWDTKDDGNSAQVIEQVWFPGVHSNIGGGYADTGLSDRTLHWIVLKAESCGLGIDGQFMQRRTEPNYHGELRDSKKGFWKLLGERPRKVCGAKGVNQLVHFSSEARSQHTTNAYWPKNLMTVLSRRPKPMAHVVEGEKQLNYFAGYKSVGAAKGYEPESWVLKKN